MTGIRQVWGYSQAPGYQLRESHTNPVICLSTGLGRLHKLALSHWGSTSRCVGDTGLTRLTDNGGGYDSASLALFDVDQRDIKSSVESNKVTGKLMKLNNEFSSIIRVHSPM